MIFILFQVLQFLIYDDICYEPKLSPMSKVIRLSILITWLASFLCVFTSSNKSYVVVILKLILNIHPIQVFYRVIFGVFEVERNYQNSSGN